MSEIVIKVENLSKQYRLGLVGTGTLSNDLHRWWHIVRGRPDPYLKVGDTNEREKSGESDYVWALRGIDLQVERGQVIGIIGRNGSGKSTLLKILSKVTGPTTGSVRLKGKLASLLEVGTGFHPELTGRENVYLNGAIMGMRKREIASKMDAIVDFAGVERYIDTPVKRYSSGMLVRLGFSVAAHLEADILLVDEVLAVGDAEFQKKCLGKMKDVSQGEGRTVLFVSHNMAMVSTLCQKALLLNNGSAVCEGLTSEVIMRYFSGDGLKTGEVSFENSEYCDCQARLLSARLINVTGESDYYFNITDPIRFEMTFEVLEESIRAFPNFHLKDSAGQHIFVTGPSSEGKFQRGKYKSTCFVPGNLLNAGTFSIGFALTNKDVFKVHYFAQDLLMFTVVDPMIDTPTRDSSYSGAIPGAVRPLLDWEVVRVEDSLSVEVQK
ncbi:MAG: ABC transporter [Candidatus Wallbacteria bacterium HGW-Wallbacteria-1]|jgi:lipopolysaccharide transport system ATP-binding protein|uniref:ABC transporter n=1 Tax=Candidatus Wallbacteria bacterium HGW-Wallbacteria-1 TaxID=2013854 RepID=A0A2N1PN00_9BACT|nr:MAG: ABC transporter [Candidatus Wallbacteria bacterium HGW-Wallbacteria-1]